MNPMARCARWSVLLLALLAGPGLHAARDVGVMVVTDMTPEGRQVPRPDRDHPVYYQAVTVGFQSFGRAIAGDREPPNDAFLQVILRTLRDEGYLPSSDQHPPTIVLGFAWGSLRGNFAGALQYLGGEKLDLMWEVQQIGGMLDPRVLTRSFRNPLQDRVMALAGDDLYVVTIAAYDRDRAIRGDLVLLWQTRIACSARGNWAADALPQIVKAAAPVIGRETDRPEWVPPSETRRRTDVQIGELKTIESFDLKDVPVLDLTKEPAP